MLYSFTAAAAVIMLLVSTVSPALAAPNLALTGKPGASSIWQDLQSMSPQKAIDGDMKTRWGGKARGEWFQIDWDSPQTFCVVIIRNYDESWNKNIPFSISIWDESLNGGSGGFKGVQTITPTVSTAVFSFPRTTTTKLRIANVITFWELEVYDDPEVAKAVNEAVNKVDIAAAGDILGHLIGTLSRNEGITPVVGAGVEVSGSNPLGKWQRTSKTDENGLFEIDLPLGSTGKISITGKSDSQVIKTDVQSADIAVSLTPIPSTAESRMSLEGQWDFAVDPSADFHQKPTGLQWKKIHVPSHWEMQGFTSETGVAAYQKAFSIPKSWLGKRIKFRSDGIYSKAEVWINGRRVGGHDGGATPFELDITDTAKPGAENKIHVLVTDNSDAGNLDAMTYYAHLNLGGIWRPIEVFCVEPEHISRLAITTDFDDAYRDAELSVDMEIVNEQSEAVRDADLKLTLVDPDGKAVVVDGLSAKVSLEPWENKRLTFRAKVAAPKQWSAEIPNLYKLKAELTGQGKAAIEQRFGFKQVEIKGRTYTVNGKPVKLWGSCRHDAHPLMGRAITPEIARQDVELMKGANLNAMRTSHYPPNPAVLDASDELGIYVEDEGPFCFVNCGYGPEISRIKNLVDDLRLAPLAISLVSSLLERDRNHPSVVMWSVCNESMFGRILQMAHKFIRKSDPTLPAGAGQSANLEIATYHNPTSMQRMKDTADFTTPVLFDEGLAIFQGFGAQAQGLELDPGLRDFWVTAHFEPVEAIIKSDHHMGSQIWAWVDDAFCVPGKGNEYGRRNLAKAYIVDDVYKMPGRGITGDPMWGVIEGWRRPRPEWWLCKKLFSPVRIKEEPLTPANPILVTVENRNFFANLNSYECRWRIGKQTGKLKSDIPPQTSGVIAINLNKAPGRDDVLMLEFFDGRGELVDGYRLSFRQPAVPEFAFSGKPARIAEEVGTLDFASIVRMTGSNCELAFDRTSGEMVRGIKGGQQVLLSGPKLHVMKSFAPLESYPAAWRFTEASYKTESDKAVLNWNGSYGNEFTGGFVIRMDDAGNVEIAYNFTYNGPESLAREVGVSLDVPLDCSRLEWNRKAEWSYYPKDHIGRPQGVAKAHPGVAQTVPPGDRPFALDDHPWGCNDFRSAKRNIYWTGLTDSNGSGIKVISDGSQHIRATVSTHSISLKVLDYYGGSATGTGEWDGTYGNGRMIKSGDTIKGVIRLVLM